MKLFILGFLLLSTMVSCSSSNVISNDEAKQAARESRLNKGRR